MRGLLLIALLVLAGIKTAHAAVPFQAGDFVSVAALGGLEVQKGEITYAQYSALKAQLPAANQTPWESQDCHYNPEGFGPNYAAGCLSFNDAAAYIRALNTQDPNYSYRLPTDEEMVRLLDMTLSALKFNGSFSEQSLSRHVWYSSNSYGHAHEVCSKDTVFGLCDILGNVWEWTNTPLYSQLPMRGSSFGGRAQEVVFGRRLSNLRGYRSIYLGFRLVRTAK